MSRGAPGREVQCVASRWNRLGLPPIRRERRDGTRPSMSWDVRGEKGVGDRWRWQSQLGKMMRIATMGYRKVLYDMGCLSYIWKILVIAYSIVNYKRPHPFLSVEYLFLMHSRPLPPPHPHLKYLYKLKTKGNLKHKHSYRFLMVWPSLQQR